MQCGDDEMKLVSQPPDVNHEIFDDKKWSDGSMIAEGNQLLNDVARGAAPARFSIKASLTVRSR
jgi:hypothetical protein